MKNYLSIIGILCALALVKCELPPELKKIMDDCAKEIGAPGDSLMGPPNFEDPKIKCLGACILKKEGVMADGKIVVEKTIECVQKFMSDLAPEVVKADVTECVGKANEQNEECDIGKAYFVCFSKKHPFPN